jgi:tetratricopeptide (TPR) repeat protein
VFARARALYAAGVLAYWQGDSDQAVLLLERSLGLLRALGDRELLGFVLNNLAMAVQTQGDLDRARAYYEEGIALFRALGQRDMIANVQGNLSYLLLATGDMKQASALNEDALANARDRQNAEVASTCLSLQSLLAWRRGDLGQAAAAAQQALAMMVAARDVRFYGDGIEQCALFSAVEGPAERVARWLGAASAARGRLGIPRSLYGPSADDRERALALAQSRTSAATWAAAYAAGQALSVEEAIAEALGASD